MTRRETREAPELGAMMGRMLVALARRAGGGEAEAVEQLAALERQVVEALTLGVRLHRAGPAEASWSDIAGLVGTSRQAAHRRFALVDDELEPVRHAAGPGVLCWARVLDDDAETTGNPDDVTCLSAACQLAKRGM